MIVEDGEGKDAGNVDSFPFLEFKEYEVILCVC